MVLFGKHHSRLRVAYALNLMYKPYNIAVLATAEALVYALSRRHAHRSCRLVMERATAKEVGTALAQRHVALDDIYNIGSVKDAVYVSIRNSHVRYNIVCSVSCR